MKIAQMLAAAGLVVASLGASTVAEAQNYRDHGSYQNSGDYRDDSRGDRDYSEYRGDHHRDRYDRGDYRHDNGNHYGSRNGRGRHQRCWVEHRHYQQVTVCR